MNNEYTIKATGKLYENSYPSFHIPYSIDLPISFSFLSIFCSHVAYSDMYGWAFALDLRFLLPLLWASITIYNVQLPNLVVLHYRR